MVHKLAFEQLFEINKEPKKGLKDRVRKPFVFSTKVKGEVAVAALDRGTRAALPGRKRETAQAQIGTWLNKNNNRENQKFAKPLIAIDNSSLDNSSAENRYQTNQYDLSIIDSQESFQKRSFDKNAEQLVKFQTMAQPKLDSEHLVAVKPVLRVTKQRRSTMEESKPSGHQPAMPQAGEHLSIIDESITSTRFSIGKRK
jgi:hypothetical protein